MIHAITNLIWFIFGGLILGLLWSIAGLILCITVIGIPLGLQCFKAAKLSFFPFGKKVELHFSKHPIANLIWLLIGGWGFAIVYLILGVLNCVTVVGIPNGIHCFKMTKLAFCPFGAKIVRS